MATNVQNYHNETVGLKVLELSKKTTPGMVLVFNQENYYNVNMHREGTQTDVESLKDTFKESLGFKVQVCNDLTTDKIKQVINEYAEHKSYEDCGSLFVFVLTHGMSYGMLHAKDDLYHVSKLWGPLKDSEALKGIPKLFFIQACRNFGETPESDISQYEARMQVPFSDFVNLSNLCLFPHDKDFFFGFSTVPGRVSFRNPEAGTWFIQPLCDQLKEMMNGKGDLISVMTNVIAEVSKQQINKKIIVGQTPVYVTALDYKICYSSTDAHNEVLDYEIPEKAPGIACILYEETRSEEAASLTSCFETLNFNVSSSTFSNRNSLLQKLREISTAASTFASIFLVFLTSLGENTLRNFQLTFEECRKPFLASNCESTRQKPKIFMFLVTETQEQVGTFDAQGSSVPKFCNDHSDMFQITCYHRGTYERLKVMLHILSIRRANIMDLLTRVLQGDIKSTQGYLSHVESTLGQNIVLGPSNMTNTTSINLLKSLKHISKSLKINGSKEAAAILLQEISEVRSKMFKIEEIELVRKKLETALEYSELNLYEKSLALYNETLEAQRRVLGDKHVDTLRTMYNMANTLEKLGRYDEALALYSECLEKQRNVLGLEHEDTLNTMHNLAVTLYNLGRYDEALSLYSECLEKQRNVLGLEHEDTLRTMHNLAVTLYNLARYDEALALYSECLEKRSKVLGLEHEDTLRTMHNLAVTLYNLGRYDEALSLYSECLEKRSKVLGLEHEDTLRTMHNLAVTLYNLGRYDEALSLYSECLEKRSKVLGLEHEDTLRTMHNLAVTLGKLGRYDEALSLYSECLEKQRNVLGLEHEDTLRTMHNLAVTLYNLARYDEALALYSECLEKRSKVLGLEHEDTLRTMHNLAVTLYNLGRYDEALALHRECLEKRTQVLGYEHVYTLNTINNMAVILNKLGRHGEALSLYSECLEKRSKVLGLEHKDTLRTMNNMAITLGKLGRQEEANTLRKESSDILNSKTMNPN